MLNAYYRKDRKTWTYRFRYPEEGGCVYTKGAFPSKKAALIAGREHLNRLTLGHEPEKGQEILTVEKLWKLYDKHCEEKQQTQKWRYSK
jgi:hypothetical protein